MEGWLCSKAYVRRRNDETSPWQLWHAACTSMTWFCVVCKNAQVSLEHDIFAIDLPTSASMSSSAGAHARRERERERIAPACSQGRAHSPLHAVKEYTPETCAEGPLILPGQQWQHQ